MGVARSRNAHTKLVDGNMAALVVTHGCGRDQDGTSGFSYTSDHAVNLHTFHMTESIVKTTVEGQ